MTDAATADPVPVPDAADDPKTDSAVDAAVEEVEESRPVEKMEAGPLVLRVKRRVNDQAAPAITAHPKRVRLNSQSDVEPSVFRLAGTLDCASDDAEISSLVARVISAPGDSETSDSGARPRAHRRRRRRHLRVVGGKRRHDSDVSEPTNVRLLDAEEEDAYGPSLSEYRRQLAGLTMNDEPLECHEVEGTDRSYVYDLYVLNEPRSSFGEMFTGIDSDDDDFGWSLTMDDYLDENYAPLGSLDDKEWKQWRTMEADCDSNPDSESNWRNEYPDLDSYSHPAPFEEEEFDLFMAGREPECMMRDSDDEDPVATAMRQMEISPGVQIEEVFDGEEAEVEQDAEPLSAPVYHDVETLDYLDGGGDREEFDLCMAGREPDLEAARERIHNRRPPGPLSVRRLAGELAAERRRQRIELG